MDIILANISEYIINIIRSKGVNTFLQPKAEDIKKMYPFFDRKEGVNQWVPPRHSRPDVTQRAKKNYSPL